MKTTRWEDLKHKSSPERRQQVDREASAELDRIGFGALRKARQQTQVEVAQTLGIDQASVSALENRTDLLLSTLTKYVRALGGDVEIRAVFPEATFNLESFLAAAPENLPGSATTKKAQSKVHNDLADPATAQASDRQGIVPTQLQPETKTTTTKDLAVSLLLHGIVFGGLIAFAYIHPVAKPWGSDQATAGAIQATMVNALPLPPRQRTLENAVLPSEKPSPAPIVAKEKTEPPPRPNEVAIPKKITKPVKVAGKPTPEPPKHPQPAPPQPTKAATGETAGIRIAMATTQLRNGTASVNVEDKTFGARFAYYINIVNRKVAEQWITGEADPRLSNGKRVTLVFDIDRAGTPSNIRIETRSGSPSLDISAMRAVQRVDGFGPLPAGDHITVEYSFDYKLQ